MLLVGLHHFARLLERLAVLRLRRRGDGQIYQVVVFVDPDMQDRLPLHLVRPGVVSPDLLPWFQLADGLLALRCRDRCCRCEATAAKAHIIRFLLTFDTTGVMQAGWETDAAVKVIQDASDDRGERLYKGRKA